MASEVALVLTFTACGEGMEAEVEGSCERFSVLGLEDIYHFHYILLEST